jgi:hypothetical protein
MIIRVKGEGNEENMMIKMTVKRGWKIGKEDIDNDGYDNDDESVEEGRGKARRRRRRRRGIRRWCWWW